jgi:hypothetical protein
VETTAVAIDLSLAAEALKKDDGDRALLNAIERVRRLASCAVDLEHARKACAVLDRLEEADLPDTDKRPIKQSLLYSAISWYIRATWTSARKGERGSFAPKFDGHLAAMHDQIRDLRNGALAHVNFDADNGGDHPWHNACVALVADGERSAVYAFAGSTDFDESVQQILAVLVPAAQQQMAGSLDDARRSVEKMVAMATVGGVEFDIERYGVDLRLLFGSIENGKRALREILA